jgi:gluconate 2-dehydrogenase gamma chain
MQLGKKKTRLSRRGFVTAGMLGGVAVAIGCSSAKQGHWDFLSDSQASTLTATICDQIVPADDFPAPRKPACFLTSIAACSSLPRATRMPIGTVWSRPNAISRKRFGRDLADAYSRGSSSRVVSALEREDHGFFELVRKHTLEGYYGSPRHGGNRDAVSWRMLGLDEPPLRGRAQYDLRKEPGS